MRMSCEVQLGKLLLEQMLMSFQGALQQEAYSY